MLYCKVEKASTIRPPISKYFGNSGKKKLAFDRKKALTEPGKI